MSHREIDSGPFPRALLVAAAVLLGAALLFVSTARVLNVEAAARPTIAPPERDRELRFEDRPDGSVYVYDARTNRRIHILTASAQGFVRSTMRSLARERRRFGAGPEVPVRLSLGRDGRLTLQDPTTGIVLDLAAFGSTNASAFARLLVAEETP